MARNDGFGFDDNRDWNSVIAYLMQIMKLVDVANEANIRGEVITTFRSIRSIVSMVTPKLKEFLGEDNDKVKKFSEYNFKERLKFLKSRLVVSKTGQREIDGRLISLTVSSVEDDLQDYLDDLFQALNDSGIVWPKKAKNDPGQAVRDRF